MYQKRNNRFEIIKLFTSNLKNRFFLREISRLTNTPLKTTQNTLKTIEEEKILLSTIEGKNKYYSLNLKNPETKLELMQTEIYKTKQFLKKHPELNSFVKELNSETPIIIFGSFAKNIETKDSDIDILIIKQNKTKETISLHLVPYQTHIINLTNNNLIKAKGETLIKEINKNHIILNNHSFWVNFQWKTK